MEGQGKAVEGQGKAVDGQEKAAHCTDGVSEKRGTVLEQGESLPFSLDVLLSHLLLREPVPLVLRPVGEAGGLSDTVVVDPVVVDVRLNGAKGGGALAKGAVFCFIALAKGAFFVLNYKNEQRKPALSLMCCWLTWSAKDGQAQRMNGFWATVSIGLARLIDCVVQSRKHGTAVSGWQQEVLSRTGSLAPHHEPPAHLLVGLLLGVPLRPTCQTTTP